MFAERTLHMLGQAEIGGGQVQLHSIHQERAVLVATNTCDRSWIGSILRSASGILIEAGEIRCSAHFALNAGRLNYRCHALRPLLSQRSSAAAKPARDHRI